MELAVGARPGCRPLLSPPHPCGSLSAREGRAARPLGQRGSWTQDSGPGGRAFRVSKPSGGAHGAAGKAAFGAAAHAPGTRDPHGAGT